MNRKQELEDLLKSTPAWNYRDAMKKYLTEWVEPVESVEEEKPFKYTTTQQRKALHVYFQNLSDALIGAGIDQKVFINTLKSVEIPMTPEFLKMVWKLVQKKMFDTDSTNHLTSSQITREYDVINKFTSQEFGISEAFPSEEEMKRLIQEHQDATKASETARRGYEYPDYNGSPTV